MKADIKVDAGKEKLFRIIKSPHVSEKATNLSDKYRQYVFEVDKSANKQLIKEAVELLFGVNVDHVRVTQVKEKTRRFGLQEGRRKGWKKAYVTLQEGHDINFADSK